jgi:glycosyltransferase involved in cell wall biosynthesis
MTTPILSICIPTYNRAHYLKNCLESLKIQIIDNPFLTDAVEIVISDNHSTDNTAGVAESYRRYFRHFVYRCAEKNVGFDLNVLNVVRNATGKYCWYLGDDDVVVNGAVSFVVDCLKNNEYDFVGIESRHMVSPEDYKKKGLFDKKSLLETKDYNEAYFNNFCQGAVSVLIFDRELWLQCVDPKDFLQEWLYFETVLKLLVRAKNKMLYINDPGVLTGQDCRWAENGREIVTFTHGNLLYQRMISFGFDKDRISKLLKENKKRILIILLRAKGHGLKCNLENYKFIYKHYGPSVDFFRFLLWSLIFIVPNKVVIMVRDLKKIIINKIKK